MATAEIYAHFLCEQIMMFVNELLLYAAVYGEGENCMLSIVHLNRAKSSHAPIHKVK